MKESPKRSFNPVMVNGSSLYYIALVTEGHLAEEIELLKLEMLQTFGCKAALKSPGHITLLSPFFWAKGFRKILIDTFQQFHPQQENIHIQLNGFGHFRKDVIFIQPEFNEQLQHLQHLCVNYFSVLLGDRLKVQKDFHPHITIANRDLKAEDFEAAWSLFRERKFQSIWEAKTISLLEHNGSNWQICSQIHLKEHL